MKHEPTLKIRWNKSDKPRLNNLQILCSCGKYHKIIS